MRPASPNGRALWWWVLGVVFLLAFGGLLAVLSSGPPGRLAQADKLGSAGGLVIGAAALLVSVLAFSRVVPWRTRSGVAGYKVLDEAAAVLGEQVRRQWTREMSVRLLDRPQPLRVRWSSTGRPVAARAADVLAGAVVGRPTRLHLRGDVNAVAETFQRLPARQMVVLGQPGAGKTVLAMLLTTALLQERHDGPVPVLLAVASWNPAEPLDVWLARRIGEDYPFLADEAVFGPHAAVRLVSSERVLPVLDGLDEMPEAWHASAIDALNDMVGGNRPVVLTCRSDEYETAIAAAGTPLARAAVVEIEPVATSDAARFLPGGQLDSETRWAPVTAELTGHPGGPLAGAMSTPLMVYLARTVYAGAGREPGELCDRARFPDRATVEGHLLDGYLPAVFDARPVTGGRYSAGRAHGWLTFLAGHLSRLGTHDFAWWQLPAALRHRRLWFGLVFGVATASVLAVLSALFGLMAMTRDPDAVSLSDALQAASSDTVGYLYVFAPIVGLLAGLAAARAEAALPVQLGLGSRLVPIVRVLAAGSIYTLVIGVADGWTYELVELVVWCLTSAPVSEPLELLSGFEPWSLWYEPSRAVIWGATFGLLLALMPDERRSVDVRLPVLGRMLRQGVVLGLGLGAIDGTWVLLYSASDHDDLLLPLSCGVVAGIAASRVADAVPRNRRRRMLAGAFRGLVAAVALAPFGAPMMATYGIAVGVGIVVPRAATAASPRPVRRAGRLLSAGRPALVASLLFGLVAFYLLVSGLAATVFGLLGFAAAVLLVVAGRDGGLRSRSAVARRLRPLREGATIGAVSGCLLAVSVVVLDGLLMDGVLIGAIVGLGVGLTASAVALATPVSDLDFTDPRSGIRGDRRATLATLTLAASVFSLLGGFDVGLGRQLGGIYGALILLAVTFRSRWPEYAAARLLLTLQQRLPGRLMPFLDDAHRRGVLRQVGAVYQFRHARLQEHLATRQSAVVDQVRPTTGGDVLRNRCNPVGDPAAAAGSS